MHVRVTRPRVYIRQWQRFFIPKEQRVAYYGLATRHKQYVSRPGTSNYIPQWDAMTCPWPWYLAHNSTIFSPFVLVCFGRFQRNHGHNNVCSVCKVTHQNRQITLVPTSSTKVHDFSRSLFCFVSGDFNVTMDTATSSQFARLLIKIGKLPDATKPLHEPVLIDQ